MERVADGMGYIILLDCTDKLHILHPCKGHRNEMKV